MLGIEWADGDVERICEPLAARQSARRPRSPQRAAAHRYRGSAGESADSLGGGRERRSAASNGKRESRRGVVRTRVAARARSEPLAAVGRRSRPSAGSRAPAAMPRATSHGRHSPMRMATVRCAPSGSTRLLQDGIAFLSDVPSDEAGILDAASLDGASFGNQLRAGIRRALGTATGKSGLFRPRPGAAHR